MDTLSEIEAAVARLARRDQVRLHQFLTASLDKAELAKPNLMEIASDQEKNGAYSAEWQAAFGSIKDPTFEVSPRGLPRPLKALDSE